MIHTVEIPDFHPARLNALYAGCWQKRHRLKAGDLELIAFYARHVPDATGKRRVTLRITLGPRQRGADPDSYWKGLLDALKRCRKIVDDNRQHVELLPVEFDRGPRRKTVLVLEDVDL